MTEAIYDAGFNSNGRFYATVGRGARHDADATTAPAAPNAEIRFAIGECSLGSILVAAASGASARSCSATIPTRWCATCRTASRRPS